MTTVALVGTGAVGARTGRQLADTPGVDRVLVAARDLEAARELAGSLGPVATAIPLDDPFPGDVRAVAVAIPGRAAGRIAARAVAAGVPAAAVADDEEGLDAIAALDAQARRNKVTVAMGCAMVPGLSDVLALHAADGLDSADEVHVARVGAAGPACVTALRRARRDRPREWHDGAWHTPRRLGAQLIWFPDPVGARECEIVAPGSTLLRATLPDIGRASVRFGEPPVRNASLAVLRRRAIDDGWGAARVEVWGWRGTAREALVYGVIERPAVAAGTVLAVTTACLAGLFPSIPRRARNGGVYALGALVDPPSFLAELARRGVKAAVFEGVATG